MHSHHHLRLSEIDYVEFPPCIGGDASHLGVRVRVRILSFDIHPPEPQRFLCHLASCDSFDRGTSSVLPHLRDSPEHQVSGVPRAHDTSLHPDAVRSRIAGLLARAASHQLVGIGWLYDLFLRFSSIQSEMATALKSIRPFWLKNLREPSTKLWLVPLVFRGIPNGV